MSINMNEQAVVQLNTPLSTQVTNVANVNYVNSQTETKGINALQGYPEVIANFQTQITSLETQATTLVKLDGSSTLSGDVSSPSISGLSTPTSTQLTNIANVNYIKNSMNQIVDQVSNNSQEISSADNKLASLTTEANNLVKLDGSSILSGDVSCPSISGLPTPTSTQLTNIANVDYVTQRFNNQTSNKVSIVPYLAYSKGTMNQKVIEANLFSFDTTKLLYQSSNASDYFQVNGENLSFLKHGVYCVFVSLGSAVSDIPLMFVQLLYYISGTQCVMSSTTIVPSILSYNLTSSFAIQKENIVGGSTPVDIQIFAAGGGSTNYITCSEMSWFVISLNLYNT